MMFEISSYENGPLNFLVLLYCDKKIVENIEKGKVVNQWHQLNFAEIELHKGNGFQYKLNMLPQKL